MVVACQMVFSVPLHIEAKMWFLGSNPRNERCFVLENSNVSASNCGTFLFMLF